MSQKVLIVLAVLFLSGCSSNSILSLGTEGQKTSKSLLKVARNLSQSGDSATASRMYRQVLTLDPENEEATLEYVFLLRKRGQIDDALDLAKAYALKKPSCPRITKEIGILYLAKNTPKEARPYLQKALKKNPEDPDLLNALGVSHDLEGRHRHAQGYYNKVLSLKPDAPSAQANKALSLALQGAHDKALPLLEARAKSRDATPQDRENLALVHGLAGRYEKASNLYYADKLSRLEVQRNIAYLQMLRKNMIYDDGDDGEAWSQDPQLLQEASFDPALPEESASKTSQKPPSQKSFWNFFNFF